MKKALLTVFCVLVATSSWVFAAAEMTLEGATSADPSAKTTVLSETLEMVSSATENNFYFTKNVRVRGTNLRMTADKMVVTALRADEPADKSSATSTDKKSSAAPTPIGTIDRIVASGNVRISQDAREATSGKAEFFPKDGRVVLTDNPRVVDAKAIVSGWRITLVQGERRVIVEQDPSGAARPTVNLESLPNLGFDPATHPEPAAPQPVEPAVVKPAATLSAPIPAATTPAQTLPSSSNK